MIPGLTSKLSESIQASGATIDANADIVKVTGNTQIDTIRVMGAGRSGKGQFLVLIPTDNSVVLSTSGNILVGITAAQNRAVFLVFSNASNKWFINSGV